MLFLQRSYCGEICSSNYNNQVFFFFGMVRTSPLVTALVRFCWPFHQQLTCWRLFLLIISISSFFGWKKNKCSAVFQVAQRKTMTRSVTSAVLQRILMKINVWKNAWHQRRWKRIKIVSVWCCLFLQCDRPVVYQSNIAGVFWICSNGFERFIDLFESDST